MDEGLDGIWRRLPFARIFIFFITGIIIERYLFIHHYHYIIVGGFLIVLLLFTQQLPLRYQWKFSEARGFSILLLILVVGGLNSALQSGKNTARPNELSTYNLLRLEGEPKLTSKTRRYVTNVYSWNGNRYVKAGKCYLYVNLKNSNKLEQGQLLLTMEKPKAFTSTSNPGAFDFSKYAHQQQVSYSVYLHDEEQWVIVGDQEKRKKSLIERSREKILFILRNTIRDKINIGLAEAMLIGFREDLDRELLNAYVDTGVVHVIAISGLHLGLIFMLIDLGIRTLFGKKRARYAGIFITIPLLWGFAILTGSSSSVNRSALMFSVLIIGKAISKRNNSLNALFASAFILLYYNPRVISDIGFQLSYAAVASILIFEKGINQLLYLKNKMARYGWNMISISIAAQLLTIPLVIFHFHRFPLLFLFTNLVAIPLSSIILVLEILLCIIYMMNIKAELIITAIELLMDWMNGYIRSVSRIPFAMMDDIYLSNLNILLSFLLFMLVAWTFLHPSKKLYHISIFLLLLLCTVRLYERRLLHHEKKVIVLNLKQATAIVIQHGKHGVIAISENHIEVQESLQKLLKETGQATGIKHWEIKSLPNLPLIINISSSGIDTKRQEKANKIILIAGNPDLTLEEMKINKGNCEKIITDGSNKLWKIQQWEKEAYGLHLPLHSTAEKGPVNVFIK